MLKNKRKYHFIYKTTNVITGRYYYGMHSTDNLNDNYLGSGHRLWYSIRKYGKENHKREILEYCKDKEELRKREEEIVDLNEIAKDDCMNLRVGGEGGFSSKEHQQKATLNGQVSYRLRLKTDKEFKKRISNICSIYMKERIKEGKMKSSKFAGKKHSDETKKKISDTHKLRGNGIGKKNSQFNTQWIFNPILKLNKKIKKYELIEEGWFKGRKEYNK